MAAHDITHAAMKMKGSFSSSMEHKPSGINQPNGIIGNDFNSNNSLGGISTRLPRIGSLPPISSLNGALLPGDKTPLELFSPTSDVNQFMKMAAQSVSGALSSAADSFSAALSLSQLPSQASRNDFNESRVLFRPHDSSTSVSFASTTLMSTGLNNVNSTQISNTGLHHASSMVPSARMDPSSLLPGPPAREVIVTVPYLWSRTVEAGKVFYIR